MKFDRGPIRAAVLFAVGLSVSACLERKEIVAPPPKTPPDDPGDFRSDQAYAEGAIVHLLFE